MPAPDYFNRVNRDLLAMIPPDAKIILEIGCGAGALCEAYLRINPHVQWIGVEKNQEAAREAANRGVDVTNTDVELDWLTDAVEPPDVVIFGDVLEHLRDPWKALARVTKPIRPDAQVLASIPNVQHFSVIYQLLIGKWDYADEGLMDRTHLRWFTQQSIRDMFGQAGLQIFEIRGIRAVNDCPGWEEWQRIIAPIHVEGFDLMKTAPLQYLVRAIKPPSSDMGRRYHIHAVGDGTICERPRLHEPFAMLSTIPGVRCTTSITGLNTAGPDPDILIQQRFRKILPSQWQRLERSLVIAEIDDDPEALEGMSDQDYAPLRAVHAIQCSTDVVAETCRQWNPNVMVVENQIAELPPWVEKHHDGVYIFFGALNREKDWAPIMPALNRVLADHPEAFMEVVYDKAFFDALETDKKEFYVFCPWNFYRDVIRSCDIALLPLEDTRFNRHKSDLKFLECAAEGVAVLASETVYGQTENPENRGFSVIYQTPKGFEQALRGLIEVIRRSDVTLAHNAYAYVRDHRLLSQHYRKRHEWYLDLMSRRVLLHQQLLARCPELARETELSTTV